MHSKNSSFPAQPRPCRHHQRLLVTAPRPQNTNAPRCAQTLYLHLCKAKLRQPEAERGSNVKKRTDLLPRRFCFFVKPSPLKTFNPLPSLSRECAMLWFHQLQFRARYLSSPNLQTRTDPALTAQLLQVLPKLLLPLYPALHPQKQPSRTIFSPTANNK